MVFSKYFFLFSTLIVSVLGATHTNLYAQVSSSVFEPSVAINISPNNPRAGSTITATLNTNSFNLDAAFVGWAINGRVLEQGIGKKTFTFNMGDIGNTIRLEAIIQPAETGDVIRRNTTITPADIDIIWEARGYTPPFYRGKARATAQGTLVFTVIPHVRIDGVDIPAQDLVYTWSKNRTVLQEYSGYGKHVAVMSLDFLSQPFTLTVEARTRNDQVVISRSVSVSPQTPQVLLYEEDPLLGTLLNKAITGNVSLKTDELWIRAIPYFSDITDRTNGFTNAVWNMNGEVVQSGPLEEMIVLRRPEGVESGRTSMIIAIDNNKKILQSVRKTFSVLIEPLTSAGAPTL